jgi:5-methylcytosine-specific restriction endonuclease McrA
MTELRLIYSAGPAHPGSTLAGLYDAEARRREHARTGKQPPAWGFTVARAQGSSGTHARELGELLLRGAGGVVEGLQIGRVVLPREPDLSPREREQRPVAGVRKAPFPPAMRAAILERAGGCCEACGRDSWWGEDIPLELDHIDPDGPNAVSNGQALCRNCHGVKTRRQRENR